MLEQNYKFIEWNDKFEGCCLKFGVVFIDFVEDFTTFKSRICGIPSIIP